MRFIISALALTLVFVTSAYVQTRTVNPNGAYVRGPGGFMTPTPGNPYVAETPSYPYVFPAPGYPNINSPSLRQQYYMYGYPYPGAASRQSR
jgi:hypothetical protein